MTEDEFLKVIAAKDIADAINKIYRDILLSSDSGESLFKVNPEQAVVYYITRLDSEVFNGGFNQFFFNSSGEFAHETVDALRRIGAKETALVLENAISFWPDNNVPKDQRTRRQLQLDKIEIVANPKWEELDSIYWKDDEKTTEKLHQFILDNSKQFHE